MKGEKLFQNRIGNQWIVITLAVALAMLLSGCFPQKPQVYKVGILSGTDDFLPIAEGFKAEMTELGYVEDENIVYDLVQTNTEPEKEQAAVEKFVQDNVDLIFTFPTEPTVTAQQGTQDKKIPIVFAYAGIEGAELVESVREPGGYITGVRFPGPEQTTKRLEILLEVVPDAKNIWVGYDIHYPNTAPSLEVLRPLASSRGVTLVEVPCATLEEFLADLAARTAADDPGVDAILIMPDLFNHAPDGMKAVLKFAAEQKVPAGGLFPVTAEGGAVFSNGNDLFKVGELAASSADKILRGTPPGEIPVLTPEQDLWINYKVAQDLGLTIPESLLGQAAEVIR